ncbi:multidrug resistance protein, MATE family [Methylobacterium phyllostachyos]|uniref:Multidrug resistance protein, MATE family n=1 Tax=Methylobacterium phyllostachyos TaxID=582672 RepID=A0A1G9TNK6_9HYPH|nr:MATE family efflux transporter [Methylobacterium phyllostachyos]SDM49231.1 multidrug resistance protein, MATE family [Methylobacterium phyllostachyos]
MTPATTQLDRPTHRRVLTLALPMTLANVTTPMLGFVGAAVIGRLGDAALLGAVALGAVIFDAIFWSFGTLRMATAGLTAQAAGARDDREVDRILARTLAAGALIGLVLVALQGLIGPIAFAISGASDAVRTGLATYFHIRILSAPFVLANYGVLGSVLGRGRTDLGLLLQVAINLMNIGLTLALVLGFGLGLAGAALATVGAEALGLGLGLVVLVRLGSHPFRVPLRDLRDAVALRRTLSVNLDVILRTLALITGIVLFSALGARQGDVVLAANSVLWNLFLIGGFFLDGFATAAETLCGRAVGARDAEAFRIAAALSLRWCLGFGLGVSLLAFAGGQTFIDFVTTNGPVREAARTYLVLAALAPLAAAAPFAYDGIYIGATWTRAMRNLMLCALAVYGAALALVQVFGLGNAGLWLAFVVFLGARGIGQAIAYPALARATFTRVAPPALRTAA